MTTIGGVNLGNLPNYLLFFADGSTDANWQGATKGFVGDVAVDGIQASERTSGSVPYAGTIFTNDNTLDAWQAIINQNLGQASGSTNQVALISGLEMDLVNAIQQISALPATPGYESVSSTSLDGLNTTNGVNEVFVINITSGLNFSSQINITGDPGDVFILRWDTDPLTPGFQGQVKPQSGGAIVPQGGLTPTNFINVAGDINASGGGSTPAPPYPQGPRYDDGQGALITGGSDFSGGGYFTGYWLTTGEPSIPGPGGILIGETSSLSNGIIVGGWYSLTTKFSMTSGTSGVYVSPNPATIEENEPAIDLEKLVSVDGGATFVDADMAPGPVLVLPTDPQFKYIVTNTGNEALVNISLTDVPFGPITIPPGVEPLAPGGFFEVIISSVPGQPVLGQHTNTGTVDAEGEISETPVQDTDPANYFGVLNPISIDVEKAVSPDGGINYYDADNPPGVNVIFPQNPQFRFVVTNTGDETLLNVELNDTIYGLVGTIPSLAPGDSQQFFVLGAWAAGQQENVVTATGTGETSGLEVSDSDPAFWFGVQEQPNPSIIIEKLVSVDDGVTFLPADTSPGPLLPEGVTPQFKFVITNNGNTPLSNVVVTDDMFGLIANFANMVPGEVQEVIYIP